MKRKEFWAASDSLRGLRGESRRRAVGDSIPGSCWVCEELIVVHIMQPPLPCSPFHSDHTCPVPTVDPLTFPDFYPPTMA